jgi:D-sedoheptulose 7-phosphate isomerase
VSNPSADHLRALHQALDSFEPETKRIDRWGHELAERLTGGARLVTVGNGGSAAHAEHLASELVGRYAEERAAFSALALHVDGSSLTALTNDYGPQEMFARQVRAHVRRGDVVIAFSTSGRSPNVVEAVEVAGRIGATTWSFTGQMPNRLSEASSDAVGVWAEATATVQEVHQVALHLLCASFDRAVISGAGAQDPPPAG